MAKRPNKFETNHPPVDANDPTQLLRAGLEVDPVEEEVEDVMATPPAPANTNDILASIAPKKSSRGRTCSIYFDPDVIKELDKLAKANKTNRSDMINQILRKLLLGE